MPESRHRLSLVAVPVAKSIDKRPHDCMIHLGIASRNTKAYRPSVLRPAAPKTHCKHSIKVFLSNWRESTTRGNRYSQAAYGLYVFTHCVSFISIAIMTTSRQAHASKIFDASSISEQSSELQKISRRSLRVQMTTALLSLVCALGVAAKPLEISGVQVDDPVSLHGATLQLNGAGIRFKTVFKVYVAALYADQKAATPEGIYAVPGPKRLAITLLRDIDSNEIAKTFAKAINGPAFKGEAARLVPELVKIERAFEGTRKLLAGETMTIDWVPGTGTVITVKGQAQGAPLNDVEVFNVLLGIWIGPYAADWKLRDSLLGKMP